MPRTPQNNDTRLDWSDREVRTERPGGGRRRVPRTHVIILDGTMSSLHKGYETHAGMLYKLLSEEGGHLSLYYEPGLQWSDWRETWSIMTGHGIDHQVRRAYGYLAAKFHADDDIYFFGYSRGAYAVRSLAGMIDCQGLLTAKNATERNVRLAFRHYRDAPDSEAAQAFREAHCHSKVRVEMVGVWDTVRALGLRVPLLWRLMPDQHGYHNHALGSTIRYGFHALAYHETRNAYAPVLWDVPEGHGSHIEQVWFPGTHGDIGGQIGGRDAVRPFSNLSLVWMLSRAENSGLMLPAGWRGRFPTDPEAPSLGGWTGWSKIFLFRGRRKALSDQSETEHPSLSVWRTFKRRGSLFRALLSQGLTRKILGNPPLERRK